MLTFTKFVILTLTALAGTFFTDIIAKTTASADKQHADITSGKS